MIFYATIKAVMRLIKKWWFLRQLHKDCLGHVANQPYETIKRGQDIGVSDEAFITYLANKSLKRLWLILLWRLRKNPKKLNKRTREYYALTTSCIDKKYITPFSRNNQRFVKVSPLGEDFLGFFPLLQKLLSEYYLAWTILIIPLLVGIYGSQPLRGLVDFIRNKLEL